MKIIQVLGVVLLAALVLIVGASAGLYWLREFQRAAAAHKVMEQYEQESLERDRDQRWNKLEKQEVKWFAEAHQMCRPNNHAKPNAKADYGTAAYAAAWCPIDKRYEANYKKEMDEVRNLTHEEVKQRMTGIDLMEF